MRFFFTFPFWGLEVKNSLERHILIFMSLVTCCIDLFIQFMGQQKQDNLLEEKSHYLCSSDHCQNIQIPKDKIMIWSPCDNSPASLF